MVLYSCTLTCTLRGTLVLTTRAYLLSPPPALWGWAPRALAYLTSSGKRECTYSL